MNKGLSEELKKGISWHYSCKETFSCRSRN
jgi:hypothetical protein